MERNIVLIGKTKSYPKGKEDNEVDVLYAYENELVEIEAAELNGKTELEKGILIMKLLNGLTTVLIDSLMMLQKLN